MDLASTGSEWTCSAAKVTKGIGVFIGLLAFTGILVAFTYKCICKPMCAAKKKSQDRTGY